MFILGFIILILGFYIPWVYNIDPLGLLIIVNHALYNKRWSTMVNRAQPWSILGF